MAAAVETHDVQSLLSSPNRDFLVRKVNGEQVKIDGLKGKKLIGLYFSSSYCKVLDNIAEVYSELFPKGDFEIIFVPLRTDTEVYYELSPSLEDFFKIPWLSIPYSDSETCDRLCRSFNFSGTDQPKLVFLDENGKVLTDEGEWIISEYGLEAFPFTPQKLKEFQELKDKRRKEQTLKSLLVSPTRDFVVTSEGKQVPVSELEGKIVGLYFQSSIIDPYADFTPQLAKVYSKLKLEEGKNFEIVMITYQMNDNEYKESFKAPWLALPFKDDSCWKLVRHFQLPQKVDFPAVIIIGADGKTLNPNAGQYFDGGGYDAEVYYPFPPMEDKDEEK